MGELWRSVKAVAWSFVGLRKGSGRDQDARLNPLLIVAVGFGAVLLLVLALMALVHVMV